MGGIQTWRAIFGLLKLDFDMDQDLLDAMAESEVGKEIIRDRYELIWREASKSGGGDD